MNKTALASLLFQAAFWTLVAFFYALSSMLESPFAPHSDSPKFWLIFKEHLIGWYSWGLLTPFIAHLARKFPLQYERRLWRNALLHLLFGAALSAFDFWFYLLLSGIVHFRFPGIDDALSGFYRYMAFISGFAMMNLCYWLSVACIHAFDFYKEIQAEKLRNAELQIKLANAELDALKMQLQPHFLFNTLNSISSLLYQDINAADKMLSRLGDFLRMTLKRTATQTALLDAEMAFLKAYLDIEQIRFQNRLAVYFEVSPDVLAAEVPSLILQPIVENAVKHGLSETISGGEIVIKAHKLRERLKIIIQDNGAGWRSTTPHREGIGLSNVQARLTKMYGDSASLTIESLPESGTSVTIELPFKFADVALGRSSAVSTVNLFK